MTKKHLYILTALVIVFAGLVFAVAYGTNNPAVFGHSASEIDLTPISIVGNNVGIGTTSPGAKLDVNGQIRATGGSVIYSCPIEGIYNMQYSCSDQCNGQLSLTSTCYITSGHDCILKNCTLVGRLVAP